jgi:hypothetical protein
MEPLVCLQLWFCTLPQLHCLEVQHLGEAHRQIAISEALVSLWRVLRRYGWGVCVCRSCHSNDCLVVQHLGEAHHQIDFAISEALVRLWQAYGRYYLAQLAQIGFCAGCNCVTGGAAPGESTSPELCHIQSTGGLLGDMEPLGGLQFGVLQLPQLHRLEVQHLGRLTTRLTLPYLKHW